MIFTNKRTSLRDAREGDAECIREAFDAETESWCVDKVYLRRGAALMFTVDGLTVGIFRLIDLDRDNDSCRITFALASRNRGKRFSHEFLFTVLKFCFDFSKMHRVSAEVYDDDFRSKRLLTKFRFSEEGVKFESRKLNGKYHDTIVYSLLKNEWNGLKIDTNQKRYVECNPRSS